MKWRVKKHTHVCVSLAASCNVSACGNEEAVNGANNFREANYLDGGSSHDKFTGSDVGEMTTRDNRWCIVSPRQNAETN